MRGYWRDQDGNMAILFALAVLPMVGVMGAAVDYSTANSYRTDMQKALDSTALALTKIMPASQATLDTKGLQHFQASMGNHDLANLQLTIVPQDGILTLTATGRYSPKLASVLGIGTFDVGAKSQAKWSIGKVEIALVLDNSGSMGSLNRMTHLKAATRDLISVLENAARQPGDAKVAIVPFDSAVRVPFNYATRPWWVKWDYWDEYVGSCSSSRYTTRSSCLAAGRTWTAIAQSTWVGCVYDRDKDPSLNHDVLDVAPINASTTTAMRTKYPAKRCDDDGVPSIQPLTDNWTTLRNKVDAMQPSGWTNITIGMVWGWHLLSSTDVYTEGAAYNTANLTKYVILMTDGDNTRNRFGDSSTTMNTRTATVCTNIKNAGIKIYSIRLIEGNASLIRGCATSPSMYYDVQNAAQLSGVFNSIGAEIANLHLSQ